MKVIKKLLAVGALVGLGALVYKAVNSKQSNNTTSETKNQSDYTIKHHYSTDTPVDKTEGNGEETENE